MIVYETLHTMKIRQKGGYASMAFKLDMAKAYGRIEWKYLEAVMRKLGYGARWIALIMECVTLVIYSVIVNGQLGKRIKLMKGLRQGDPMSPYLFILCAEGLSSLINSPKNNGETMGVLV